MIVTRLFGVVSMNRDKFSDLKVFLNLTYSEYNFSVSIKVWSWIQIISIERLSDVHLKEMC